MKKILIIGDSCRDYYQYGKCERLSPEAPVPVFKPTNMVGSGGMAYNVFANLKALKIDCDLITNPDMPRKTRYVDEVSNQMLLRVDEKDNIERIELNSLHNIDFKQYDAVVISDYNKGFLQEEDIDYISHSHKLVFLDTKKKIGNWCSGTKFIKINETEFNNNAVYLLKEYNGELIVTLGKNGAMHWMNKYPIEEEHAVRDLSGAGDTFFAGFVANYLNYKDICRAIQFANKCASWVVTQKGVVVVDLNKIL